MYIFLRNAQYDSSDDDDDVGIKFIFFWLHVYAKTSYIAGMQ